MDFKDQILQLSDRIKNKKIAYLQKKPQKMLS